MSTLCVCELHESAVHLTFVHQTIHMRLTLPLLHPLFVVVLPISANTAKMLKGWSQRTEKYKSTKVCVWNHPTIYAIYCCGRI